MKKKSNLLFIFTLSILVSICHGLFHFAAALEDDKESIQLKSVYKEKRGYYLLVGKNFGSNPLIYVANSNAKETEWLRADIYQAGDLNLTLDNGISQAAVLLPNYFDGFSIIKFKVENGNGLAVITFNKTVRGMANLEIKAVPDNSYGTTVPAPGVYSVSTSTPFELYASPLFPDGELKYFTEWFYDANIDIFPDRYSSHVNLSVKGDASITAKFADNPALVINEPEKGGGTTVPSPAIYPVYDPDEPTIIKAVADSGWVFSHWNVSYGIYIANSNAVETEVYGTGIVTPCFVKVPQGVQFQGISFVSSSHDTDSNKGSAWVSWFPARGGVDKEETDFTYLVYVSESSDPSVIQQPQNLKVSVQNQLYAELEMSGENRVYYFMVVAMDSDGNISSNNPVMSAENNSVRFSSVPLELEKVVSGPIYYCCDSVDFQGDYSNLFTVGDYIFFDYKGIKRLARVETVFVSGKSLGRNAWTTLDLSEATLSDIVQDGRISFSVRLPDFGRASSDQEVYDSVSYYSGMSLDYLFHGEPELKVVADFSANRLDSLNAYISGNLNVTASYSQDSLYYDSPLEFYDTEQWLNSQFRFYVLDVPLCLDIMMERTGGMGVLSEAPVELFSNIDISSNLNMVMSWTEEDGWVLSDLSSWNEPDYYSEPGMFFTAHVYNSFSWGLKASLYGKEISEFDAADSFVLSSSVDSDTSNAFDWFYIEDQRSAWLKSSIDPLSSVSDGTNTWDIIKSETVPLFSLPEVNLSCVPVPAELIVGTSLDITAAFEDGIKNSMDPVDGLNAEWNITFNDKPVDYITEQGEPEYKESQLCYGQVCLTQDYIFSPRHIGDYHFTFEYWGDGMLGQWGKRVENFIIASHKPAVRETLEFNVSEGSVFSINLSQVEGISTFQALPHIFITIGDELSSEKIYLEVLNQEDSFVNGAVVLNCAVPYMNIPAGSYQLWIKASDAEAVMISEQFVVHQPEITAVYDISDCSDESSCRTEVMLTGRWLGSAEPNITIEKDDKIFEISPDLEGYDTEVTDGSGVTLTAVSEEESRLSFYLPQEISFDDSFIIHLRTMNGSASFLMPKSRAPTPILTLKINDEQMGTSNAPPGQYVVSNGQPMEITAMPYQGFIFSRWGIEGDGSLSASDTITTSVTLNGDATVTAFFEPCEKWKINIFPSTYAGSTDPADGKEYEVDPDTSLVITAYPLGGYVFTQWESTGDIEVLRPYSRSTEIFIKGGGEVTAIFDLESNTDTVRFSGIVNATSFTSEDGETGDLKSKAKVKWPEAYSVGHNDQPIKYHVYSSNSGELKDIYRQENLVVTLVDEYSAEFTIAPPPATTWLLVVAEDVSGTRNDEPHKIVSVTPGVVVLSHKVYFLEDLTSGEINISDDGSEITVKGDFWHYFNNGDVIVLPENDKTSLLKQIITRYMDENDNTVIMVKDASYDDFYESGKLQLHLAMPDFSTLPVKTAGSLDRAALPDAFQDGVSRLSADSLVYVDPEGSFMAWKDIPDDVTVSRSTAKPYLSHSVKFGDSTTLDFNAYVSPEILTGTEKGLDGKLKEFNMLFATPVFLNGHLKSHLKGSGNKKFNKIVFSQNLDMIYWAGPVPVQQDVEFGLNATLTLQYDYDVEIDMPFKVSCEDVRFGIGWDAKTDKWSTFEGSKPVVWNVPVSSKGEAGVEAALRITPYVITGFYKKTGEVKIKIDPALYFNGYFLFDTEKPYLIQPYLNRFDLGAALSAQISGSVTLFTQPLLIQTYNFSLIKDYLDPETGLFRIYSLPKLTFNTWFDLGNTYLEAGDSLKDAVTVWFEDGVNNKRTFTTWSLEPVSVVEKVGEDLTESKGESFIISTHDIKITKLDLTDTWVGLGYKDLYDRYVFKQYCDLNNLLAGTYRICFMGETDGLLEEADSRKACSEPFKVKVKEDN